MDPQKILLISDFNCEILKGYLDNNAEVPSLQASCSTFGQPIQTLLNPSDPIWQSKYDALLIWTQPQAVIESFHDCLNFKHPSLDTILNQVDEYADIILENKTKASHIFIPTWSVPSCFRGFALLDHKQTGIAYVLSQMNARLASRFMNEDNIFILDSQKWIESVGPKAFNSKMWYLSKTPFDLTVLQKVAVDIKAALCALAGQTKKLVIVDLDDTLWGGIVGDVGWEHLRLGGHDAIGEAYLDFQKALKSLTNRGILLGIVSKNEESIALDAIDQNPEMFLKRENFAAWRINWDDKVQNILDLVEELNLGLQSVVFIDDNPVERARVKEVLPELLVPDWPKDHSLFKETLLSMSCFDQSVLTEEDSKRNEYYQQEKKRTSLKRQIPTPEEWIKTLQCVVEIDVIREANIQRTVQLLNKTNQMNLSTRRLTEDEFRSWMSLEQHTLWTFRVRDKFGDNGLTGIVSVAQNNHEGIVVDFILSCRVFGRFIEDLMLAKVCQWAQMQGIKTITAQYIPTAKNKPCLDFLKRSILENRGEDLYRREMVYHVENPDAIEVIDKTLDTMKA